MKWSGLVLFSFAVTTTVSAFAPTSGKAGRIIVVQAHQESRQLPPLHSSVANIIEINEDITQRDVYSMQEWASNCGVQTVDGFQLVSEDGTDFGVATEQDLPAGTSVVVVPNQILLTSWSAAEEFGPYLQQAENQLAQGGLDYQIPLFRLFVKILAEFEKGDQSPYFPWLNSLPRRFNNGAAMTYACFECLPPYIAWLSLKERQYSVNFQKAAKLIQGCLDESTVTNRDVLKWAYCVAVTRSFDVNGEKVIAPVADMFNHGTETEVDVGFDDAGNCIMYTTTDVPAGSPLRMSLGDPTNPSPLFATYGFIDKTSPATFCKLMDKQEEIQALGLDFSNLLFYKDTGDISAEVWDVMLYSILGQDPDLRQGFYQAYTSGDMDTKNSYHQQYFPYTLEALKKHVDGTLRELDELSFRASSKDPSTHPRVPLILQHNDFVKSTFLKVKRNLDAM